MRDPISPGLKSALDLGPVLAFLVGYMLLRDHTFTIAGQDYGGFIVVTAAFVPLLLASTALLWKLTGKISKMQVVTAGLVIIFGGLTVWLNDERFIKMKSTIVFGLFSAILTLGLIQGRSYLAWIMEELMPLAQEGWMILTRRIAWLFAAMAAGNEVIWRLLSTDIFVAWDTFGQPIAIFAFFMTQAGLLQRYALEQNQD